MTEPGYELFKQNPSRQTQSNDTQSILFIFGIEPTMMSYFTLHFNKNLFERVNGLRNRIWVVFPNTKTKLASLKTVSYTLLSINGPLFLNGLHLQSTPGRYFITFGPLCKCVVINLCFGLGKWIAIPVLISVPFVINRHLYVLCQGLTFRNQHSSFSFVSISLIVNGNKKFKCFSTLFW